MPRASRICAQPGCPEITSGTHCDAHRPKPWSTGDVGKGRGGRPWRRQRQQQFAADDYTCQGCGHRDPTTKTLECDHDDHGQTRTLCVDCHRRRTLAQAHAARTMTTD